MQTPYGPVRFRVILFAVTRDSQPYVIDQQYEIDDLKWFPLDNLEAPAVPAMVDSHQRLGNAVSQKLEKPYPDLDYPIANGSDISMEVKVPLSDRSVAHDMQLFMNDLLGGDKSLTGPAIRLDDEVFALATVESQRQLFPVSHHCFRMHSNLLKSPHAHFNTGEIPEKNPEQYRWRGDLELLDRLAYNSPSEIPRNWKMMSMDTGRMEEYNRNNPPEIEYQARGAITDVHLRNIGNSLRAESYNAPPEVPPSEYRTEDRPPGSQQTKKKRTNLSMASNIRRTRVDLYKREHGNNRYGRKGNLRCLACRKREGKVSLVNHSTKLLMFG